MRRHAPNVLPNTLDTDALLAQLEGDVARRIERLELFATLGSTNAYLLRAAAPSRPAVNVCIADHQTHGRGRRGRRWSMPPGAGLCLSAAACIDTADCGSLPLAAGVAARRAIAAACGVSIALKWPNDLAWSERKLGGILVERAPRSRGGHSVIGIGVNVDVPDEMLGMLCDWPAGAVDLAEATGGRPPSRAALAARLIAELVELAACFPEHGLAPYRDELAAADMLYGQPVRVAGERAALRGVARGVDERGALLVDTPDGTHWIRSGDVSVRTDRDGAASHAAAGDGRAAGDRAPGAAGDTALRAAGDRAPGAVGDTVLRAPGDRAPRAAGDVVPRAAGDTVPDAARDATRHAADVTRSDRPPRSSRRESAKLRARRETPR